MGESASARTERELRALRGQIDADVAAILSRVKRDLDPKQLVRRQPAAVIGGLSSVAVAAGATILAKTRLARRQRPFDEVDKVLERLSTRAGKITGGARRRLRERLREELSEVEKPKRTISEAAWAVGLAAITSGATEFARHFAGRLTDDEVVSSEEAEGSPR